MPIGRGSKKRIRGRGRRAAKRKYARIMARTRSDHPLVMQYERGREKSMRAPGKYRLWHPLERKKDRPDRMKMIEKHNEAAATRVAENAARRRENWR